MTKLLVIETSPRGKHSVSRSMTRRFVQEWVAAHPAGEVIERDEGDGVYRRPVHVLGQEIGQRVSVEVPGVAGGIDRLHRLMSVPEPGDRCAKMSGHVLQRRRLRRHPVGAAAVHVRW